RMVLAEHSWRFFVHNLYFLLLSVPYLNIVDWTGVALSHEEAMLMGLVPLLRALLGLYVLFSWIIENKVTRLLTTYVLSLSVFTYFAALVFYDYEVRINPAVRDFGDAVWWACMNLTTVGSDIVAVTVIGKVLTVLLPTMGMLMFPIFTVYVTQLYTRNRSEERDKP
ncbi:MAG: potassium channel family protein, partial [Alistipes sp.]|nr:potassium channel family protein [Alistipes sp.]